MQRMQRMQSSILKFFKTTILLQTAKYQTTFNDLNLPTADRR